MTVDRDFVSSLSRGENSEINEEELADLERAVSSRRAFNKAVDLLSRRDHSVKELSVKLRQRGFTDEIEVALEKLSSYGYLDDERFARNFANELVRIKGYGKRRIEEELYRKGISRDIISVVLEETEFPEDKLTEIIRRKYLRFLDDEKGVKKTISALLRMGYSYGEIKTALEKTGTETEDDGYDLG